MDTERRSKGGRAATAWHWYLHEMRLLLPPTIFFAVGFNLVLFTQNLVLAQYRQQLAGYLVAVMAALVVGKAVLVADKMPFLRLFDRSPLIYPIVFRSLVYWAFVFAFRLIEAFLHYVFEHGHAAGFGEHMIGVFSWHRFLFVQIWILVLFLVYVTAAELNALFGDGELFRLFFRWRPTELKQTRRQRIRALAKISRLTERQPLAVLRDPESAPHREIVHLLEQLAGGDARPTAPSPPPGDRP